MTCATLFLHLAPRLLGETWVRGVCLEKSNLAKGWVAEAYVLILCFSSPASECPGVRENALDNALRPPLHGLDMTSNVCVLPAG